MAKTQVKNKISSKRYEKYENGKAKKPFCPKCGPGIFLAIHKDRKVCGSCSYMESS